MAVRVLRHSRVEKPVDARLLIDTIEKNRDRTRAVGNMLLTMSGVMISTCIGVSLFIVQRRSFSRAVFILVGSAAALFLLSGCLSILSSFLRTTHSITTEEKFISDLLQLQHSEARRLRWSFSVLASGIVLLVCGLLLIF